VKLLMFMTPTECLDHLLDVMKAHHVTGYTELPNLPGTGLTGGRFGTRAFPGTSSILLSIVAPGVAERLTESLRADRDLCEHTRVFAMPVEPLL